MSASALDLPFYTAPAAKVIQTWVDIQKKHGQALIMPLDGTALNLGMANALQQVILSADAPIKPILDRAVADYNTAIGKR